MWCSSHELTCPVWAAGGKLLRKRSVGLFKLIDFAILAGGQSLGLYQVRLGLFLLLPTVPESLSRSLERLLHAAKPLPQAPLHKRVSIFGFVFCLLVVMHMALECPPRGE